VHRAGSCGRGGAYVRVANAKGTNGVVYRFLLEDLDGPVNGSWNVDRGDII
jgi:hypothetical protein